MKIHVKKIYKNSQIIDNQLLICENGKIFSLQNYSDEAVDAVYNNLSAGLFDTHLNGGFTQYFTQSPTEEALADFDEACRTVGTAYVLPTLITSPIENILKGIEAIQNYRAKHPETAIVGMHLEGPFLHIKKRGAHLEKYIQKPSNEVIEEIIRYGKDTIKIMTIAPENFTDSQLERLLSSGIKLAAGHSNATFEEANHAFSKGISLVTHLFNAMSGLNHRQPGLVGATLANTSVYAPIILDGHHCHYGAAKAAYLAKKETLFLVSDALFLGKKTTHFQWEEFDATLHNGRYSNSEGNLAGAAISLGDAVRNAVEQLDIPIEEAIEMASSRPAKAVGLEKKIGKIDEGFPAVFTTFDNELKSFQVVRFS